MCSDNDGEFEQNCVFPDKFGVCEREGDPREGEGDPREMELQRKDDEVKQ